ncbi:MAG: hypothetical protein LKJ69_04370 [Lactobacillus sp.]|jgi:hypothetical protein|nr:hypothetical protein [Lactobacillus sp.]MCI2032617.1 hypothetical protein [Lactobacillus sp.]
MTSEALAGLLAKNRLAFRQYVDYPRVLERMPESAVDEALVDFLTLLSALRTAPVTKWDALTLRLMLTALRQLCLRQLPQVAAKLEAICGVGRIYLQMLAASGQLRLSLETVQHIMATERHLSIAMRAVEKEAVGAKLRWLRQELLPMQAVNGAWTAPKLALLAEKVPVGRLTDDDLVEWVSTLDVLMQAEHHQRFDQWQPQALTDELLGVIVIVGETQPQTLGRVLGAWVMLQQDITHQTAKQLQLALAHVERRLAGILVAATPAVEESQAVVNLAATFSAALWQQRHDYALPDRASQADVQYWTKDLLITIATCAHLLPSNWRAPAVGEACTVILPQLPRASRISFLACVRGLVKLVAQWYAFMPLRQAQIVASLTVLERGWAKREWHAPKVAIKLPDQKAQVIDLQQAKARREQQPKD